MDESLIPWFVRHDKPEELYTRGCYLVLDFETDTVDKGSAVTEENDLVLACWQVVASDGTVRKKAHIFGGIYEMQELLDDIGKVDFIVAQNLKFELQWLKRCGLELRDVLGYDTILAQWVMDGNRNNGKYARDLGSIAKRYKVAGKFDLIGLFIKAGVSPRDISPRWLLEYCHADVEACKQIFIAQQAHLSARKQWHLVHTRNLCCSVLADIEFEGLHLDPERVHTEYIKSIEIRDRLGSELSQLTGGINLNSPKQLATYLYDTLKIPEPKDHKGNVITTDGGDSTANAKVLPLLKATTPEQLHFLKVYKEYSKVDTLLTKNLDYFRLTCEQRGCVFYGSFQQNVVQTHRLSSVGRPVLFKGLKKAKSVQFQNIPRAYKGMFWSGDEDWVCFEADSSQLEFRVAVDLGHDKVGLEEIENGVDVHAFTAQVLLENKDPELVGLPAKDRRQESKKHTFRPLFGGSSGSKALVAYCQYFKDKYKGISRTQLGWALKCIDKKQFTTPYGMVFYFPGTKMNRNGYISNTTSIYNYPIQGFATGEIIPIALVYFWHRTRHLRVRIMSTIHDSIASKVHKDDVEEAKLIAKQALTLDVYEFLNRVYHYKFRVPLGLGMKASRNWGDTKIEQKFDIYPDGSEIER